ncbi:hypothetical protein DL89DRAFT_267945 [Linderina pennispora]|uniref:ZN622/Rei1/Reh1 zinc finger C2H2-type domain-containing protein n=1 Tax=Linderina pennispora TaxID=61395 RepID=A0A1Y1W8S1_9FUNG|nr:uncharacterized protein DL89DRAFT_267945 [Linderina pennispora]ORX69795.1 hypothetical protein DL89DRAFT_267945 [Linderina pennispora]
MADDEWQTVPERARPQRGRGGYRGGRGGQRNRTRSTSTAGAADRLKTAEPQQRRNRSRARAAPVTSGHTQQFKLQTSNMFALHVGKSSRARKNEDLKEFFEARDDDEGEEENFDDIDDDDLDVSDYEPRRSRPVPVLIHCSFCPGTKTGDDGEEIPVARPLLRSATELTSHLRENPQPGKPEDKATFGRKETADDGVVTYFIDAASCEADKEVRSQVQKERLEEILDMQDIERHGEALEPHKCLFCKHVCDDRADLTTFNIGLPDNLVNVNEFLYILESKLGIATMSVLRKHMRKKKHFKISARNRLYDRFYVVNYLEPGKSWEAIENENEKADSEADEADRKDDSWADWDERADLPTVSLFDDHISSSPDECWKYLKAEFNFDIHQLRADAKLDFYKDCCSKELACFARFAAHVKQAGAAHLAVPAEDSPIWKDSKNFVPVIDSDPLLMAFEDDADFADVDEEKSRKMLEESKKILRKKFDQISLESPKKDDCNTADAEPVSPTPKQQFLSCFHRPKLLVSESILLCKSTACPRHGVPNHRRQAWTFAFWLPGVGTSHATYPNSGRGGAASDPMQYASYPVCVSVPTVVSHHPRPPVEARSCAELYQSDWATVRRYATSDTLSSSSRPLRDENVYSP